MKDNKKPRLVFQYKHEVQEVITYDRHILDRRIDPYYPRLFRRIIAAVNKRKSRGGTSEKTPMRPFEIR